MTVVSGGHIDKYYSLLIAGKEGKPIVSVHPDGRVEIDSDIGEAARALWHVIEEQRTAYLAGRSICATCKGTGIENTETKNG